MPSPKASINFIDLMAQQARIRTDLVARIESVLAHGQYILGPEVGDLENRLAKFVGVRNCITCANGTDALQIAMMACGVGPGDEVITTAFSFFATVETILILGATPIFCDIDPNTYNLDPTILPKLITPKTKMIVPVSLYGECPEMDSINEIAKAHNLIVLEDAAQSFGAIYKGQKSCALSKIATTSFFPSKPLGCYGDGGAIFTDDDSLAMILRQIRVHGQKGRYHHVRIGVNSRLDTLQAAVLLAKLEIFEDELKRRCEVAERYRTKLPRGVKSQKIRPSGRSSYAQFTIEIARRDEIVSKLAALGIPTAVHYPEPLHRQPAVAFSEFECPAAEHAASTVLSLPFSPYLTIEIQDHIVSALTTVI